MPHIRPTREQFLRVAESELDGPVVMLNLLKFDKQAKDGEGSGRDAYQRYGDELASIMEARGIKLLWRGRADSVVIGDDEADGWDEVLLVQYPSRKVFAEMAGSKEYEGVGKHRTSALVDSRLIACTQKYPGSS
jgi:uncharacterized protein (DUF1330 family)